jgi:phage FluMu gp28-like protein
MWGGVVRVISTHNGADNPFHELVNDIRAGRRPYSLHRVTLDDAIADGLYHRICQKAGSIWNSSSESDWRALLLAEYGEAADEELMCVPRASGGTFLSSVLVEHRMRADLPVIRWEAPPLFANRPEAERIRETADFCETQLGPILGAIDRDAMTCFGEDFGRSVDLTVIWPLQLMRNLVRRTLFILELRNMPFRQQEQILFYIVDRLPHLIAGAMDASGNGAYLAEMAMQRYGARIQQIKLGVDWYREHMPRYKAAFEDGAIDLPRDADILGDHRALVMEKGVVHVPERRLRGEDGKPRHADSAIAGALAYYASQVDPVEFSYVAVRSRREDDESLGSAFRSPTDDDVRPHRGGRFGTITRAW